MRHDVFGFALPPELIASRPARERDGARLLVVDPARRALEHRHARELDELLPPGALVVVNDTRVLPARLLGAKRDTGGRIELLLVRRLGASEGGGERWLAMGRASKPMRPGALLRIEPADPARAAATGGGAELLAARVEGRGEGADEGLLRVVLESPAGLAIDAAIEAVGHVPLPPYLGRDDDAEDRERYQTVFAREPGAVAAPTAGLHLSPALLERLARRGVELATITLHVGPGTFQPVTAVDLDDHAMHEELFAIPDATAGAVARARERRAPVVAVGTTVVRALESAADPARPGAVIPGPGATRLLIQPGYAFRVIDRLVTNFHLPESTLLALVCAFGGTELVLAAYRQAIEARYRFFSYGDAMLLTGRAGAGAT